MVNKRAASLDRSTARPPAASAECMATRAADAWHELLDVLDPRDPTGNTVVGREQRRRVHERGLLHRSVHVQVVRRRDGALLLQRRAARKAICPLAWDLSCAEHVAAGETFDAAAVRGVREELGLAAVVAAAGEHAQQHHHDDDDGEATALVLRPLDGGHAALQLYEYPAAGLTDYESNRIYLLSVDDEHAAQVRVDGAEVERVEWVAPHELAARMHAHDAAAAAASTAATTTFTPWFIDQARKHQLLLLLPSPARSRAPHHDARHDAR